MKSKIQLYNYFRSSCSYRVRIALHLKNLPFEYKAISLLKKEQSTKYKEINPEELVPSLVHGSQVITQSMAILQYLDMIKPQPTLFPKQAFKKARVISLCEVINSSTQPLHNLRVLKYLKKNIGSSWDKNKWLQTWISKGLLTVEKKMEENRESVFAVGKSLTAAEVCIIPQLYTARRFNVSLKNYPRLLAIEVLCKALPAFKKAHPQQQIDS